MFYLYVSNTDDSIKEKENTVLSIIMILKT